jgi:hypothetical protein
MNTETGPLAKGHNSYPWEFQQTVGRPIFQQLHIVYERTKITNSNQSHKSYREYKSEEEEFKHLFNFNFGVLVR